MKKTMDKEELKMVVGGSGFEIAPKTQPKFKVGDVVVVQKNG